MRRVLIFSLAALVILIFTSALYSSEMSKVLMKNGTVVKGEIIETKEDGSLVFKTTDGFTITIYAEDIHQVVKFQYPNTGSVGVGIGIPYGVFGINGEYNIPEVDNLAISVGIGSTIFAGTGFNAGAKYYFRDIGNTWRPRAMIFYGTNSLIVIETDSYYAEDDYEAWKYEGLTLGAGQQWTFGESKSHAMDLDVMYILTQGDFDDQKEALEYAGYDVGNAGKIKISIGYRYCF